MVTVRLASKGGLRVVVLDGLLGSTRVEELLRRLGRGVPGAEALVRSQALRLDSKDSLAVAGLVARGVVHVCAGEEGGMLMLGQETPGIFAVPGRGSEGSDQGLVEKLGYLLGRFSEDLSEIERAVLRLEVMAGSGEFCLCLCLLLPSLLLLQELV
jgi:hypothetical protein